MTDYIGIHFSFLKTPIFYMYNIVNYEAAALVDFSF